MFGRQSAIVLDRTAFLNIKKAFPFRPSSSHGLPSVFRSHSVRRSRRLLIVDGMDLRGIPYRPPIPSPNHQGARGVRLSGAAGRPSFPYLQCRLRDRPPGDHRRLPRMRHRFSSESPCRCRLAAATQFEIPGNRADRHSCGRSRQARWLRALRIRSPWPSHQVPDRPAAVRGPNHQFFVCREMVRCRRQRRIV
jgi:hypothetical protein